MTNSKDKFWTVESTWETIQKFWQSLQPFAKKEEAEFLWFIERGEWLSADWKENLAVWLWQFFANLPWNTIEFAWDLATIVGDPGAAAEWLWTIWLGLIEKASRIWLTAWTKFWWMITGEDTSSEIAKLTPGEKELVINYK